jgi:hypothetical protein
MKPRSDPRKALRVSKVTQARFFVVRFYKRIERAREGFKRRRAVHYCDIDTTAGAVPVTAPVPF